jgi:RNA recognition motif-containing protein
MQNAAARIRVLRISGKRGNVKKLYVGNLPFTTTQEELQEIFERFGSVASAAVIMDRETGRSRGFGFIEMEEASAADEAIKQLDGSDFGGRSLRVNEAHDRRGGGGGGGGGRGRY